MATLLDSWQYVCFSHTESAAPATTNQLRIRGWRMEWTKQPITGRYYGLWHRIEHLLKNIPPHLTPTWEAHSKYALNPSNFLISSTSKHRLTWIWLVYLNCMKTRNKEAVEGQPCTDKNCTVSWTSMTRIHGKPAMVSFPAPVGLWLMRKHCMDNGYILPAWQGLQPTWWYVKNCCLSRVMCQAGIDTCFH